MTGKIRKGKPVSTVLKLSKKAPEKVKKSTRKRRGAEISKAKKIFLLEKGQAGLSENLSKAPRENKIIEAPTSLMESNGVKPME